MVENKNMEKENTLLLTKKINIAILNSYKIHFKDAEVFTASFVTP